MDGLIEFFIPHTVIGKKAPKFARMGKFTRAYKPEEEEQNSATIASLIQAYVPETPLKGPLRLHMHCFYPWRSGISKKKRAQGVMAKDTKPDCDNIAKQLADVMAKMGFFYDDGQIAQLTVNKWWGGERVGVDVRIEEIK